MGRRSRDGLLDGVGEGVRRFLSCLEADLTDPSNRDGLRDVPRFDFL